MLRLLLDEVRDAMTAEARCVDPEDSIEIAKEVMHSIKA